jgi:hypothetical protein
MNVLMMSTVKDAATAIPLYRMWIDRFGLMTALFLKTACSMILSKRSGLGSSRSKSDLDR